MPSNVLRFSCRRGAAKTVKMRTISRAEGGQLQAPVGPGAVVGVRLTPHSYDQSTHLIVRVGAMAGQFQVIEYRWQ